MKTKVTGLAKFMCRIEGKPEPRINTLPTKLIDYPTEIWDRELFKVLCQVAKYNFVPGDSLEHSLRDYVNRAFDWCSAPHTDLWSDLSTSGYIHSELHECLCNWQERIEAGDTPVITEEDIDMDVEGDGDYEDFEGSFENSPW